MIPEPELPAPERGLLQRGLATHNAGEATLASRFYDQHPAEAPGDADAWRLSGCALRGLDDRAAAEARLRRAVALALGDAEARASLGHVLAAA